MFHINMFHILKFKSNNPFLWLKIYYFQLVVAFLLIVLCIYVSFFKSSQQSQNIIVGNNKKTMTSTASMESVEVKSIQKIENSSLNPRYIIEMLQIAELLNLKNETKNETKNESKNAMKSVSLKQVSIFHIPQVQMIQSNNTSWDKQVLANPEQSEDDNDFQEDEEIERIERVGEVEKLNKNNQNQIQKKPFFRVELK
jgi:hypothetical protein